jgi:hypothetical protein
MSPEPIRPDQVVAAPLQSRRRAAWRSARLILLAVLYVLAGAFVARMAVTEKSFDSRQRIFCGVFAAALLLTAGVYFALVPFLWVKALSIDGEGMDIGATRLAWDQITCCQWNRYIPSVLTVRTALRTRLFVGVPYGKRASVEAALRSVGKWQST